MATLPTPPFTHSPGESSTESLCSNGQFKYQHFSKIHGQAHTKDAHGLRSPPSTPSPHQVQQV
ncbi:hypothetical protein BDN72DRAFT_907469 [Pluteus cervinus]|uniref:Uncharacterized protein n=1 Tax=Pluteus cervinus TaxID=181527 RepID=A0ACD2ZWG5_9AGAR|nr:hypothetical protein BDN72DRAFT_907469 [Pluteus cervinus]